VVSSGYHYLPSRIRRCYDRAVNRRNLLGLCLTLVLPQYRAFQERRDALYRDVQRRLILFVLRRSLVLFYPAECYQILPRLLYGLQ
jgi:hypothetical protein